MAKSHSARSSDSNLQSRQQGGRWVRGRGLWDSSGGAWARQRLTLQAGSGARSVFGALEVLTKRSAQPSLSWRGGYKASDLHVPAFGFLKGAAPQA